MRIDRTEAVPEASARPRIHPFTAVMAASILSTSAELDRHDLMSSAFLLAGVMGLALTIAIDAGSIRRVGSGTVAIVLLTWVAACAGLSERFGPLSRPGAVGFAILAMAGSACAVVVIGWAGKNHVAAWPSWPVRGSWLLGVVVLQSLSILAGSAEPLLAAGLWAPGLVVYAAVMALILRRLRHGSVSVTALTPDYWITMGALAISIVALYARGPGGTAGVLLWVTAAALIPLLCVTEVLRVRRFGLAFRYDALRWSTVFPLGMFSVASHDVAAATRLAALATVGEIAFWAGLAVAAANVMTWMAAIRRRGADV